MTLNDQTKIGLTFGQAMWVLILLGSFGSVGLRFNSRMVAMEISIQHEKEKNITRDNNDLIFRSENRQDHLEMSKKQDFMINSLLDRESKK